MTKPKRTIKLIKSLLINYLIDNRQCTMRKISEDLKTRFPSLSDANGLILVFTKDFALNKLSGLLQSDSRGLAKKFKPGSVSDFEENYALILNGTYIEKANMFREIANLEEKKVTDISIKDSGNNKMEILIKTIK